MYDKKLKVLVADNQVVVRQKLVQKLSKDKDIAIIGIVDNGKEAFEIYQREQIDIVIFDLLLPVYDGYTLLDKINESGINNDVKLIMTTPITSDLLVSEAFYRKVDYVLTKPYDENIVSEKIKKIYWRMNEIIEAGTVYTEKNIHKYNVFNFEEMETVISKKLNEVGIPAKLKGYRYMITAITEVLNNDESLDAVTKILYPDVAKKHNSTAQRVEKAIRHAIEVAWNVNEDNPIKKQFELHEGKEKNRPTNSEFIAKISQDIRHIA